MKKQQGFTLIELVIVVIILGFLAAAAIPRFIDATDDARDASVAGVAGGMASAAGLVRAQWELSGRPAVTAALNYDGQLVFLSATGYPTSTDSAATAAQMSSVRCKQVMDSVLASAPTSVRAGLAPAGSLYVTNVHNNGFGGTSDICVYSLIESHATLVGNNGNTATAVNNDTGSLVGQGFTYAPAAGVVTPFGTNNN